MIRLAAIPWITLAVILLAVAVAVFFAPWVERLRTLTVPTVPRRSRLRGLLVGALVMLDAKRDDRRRRARRNGKPTTAELEAIAAVELDREARQV